MSAATNTTILTPDIYLNHLPPDQVPEFEVSRNVYIAVLGALACDILSYIPSDIRVIRQSKGFITMACFVFARVFAVIYMALWVTMSTTPVANCTGLLLAANVFCVLTMGTTSFLFLRRVQAAYHDNRMVNYASILLWAGTSGVAFMLIPGTEAEHIPGTGYCTVYKAQRYDPIINFMPAVFDSLVFFAISYQIVYRHNQVLGSESNWARTWFSTKSLPVVTRAFLQGGQQYYFVTFAFNILSGAFSFSPFVPPMHHILFSVPSAALSACMACRAHRVLVAACYRDEVAPPLLSPFAAAKNNSAGSVSHTTVVVGVEKTVLERSDRWRGDDMF